LLGSSVVANAACSVIATALNHCRLDDAHDAGKGPPNIWQQLVAPGLVEAGSSTVFMLSNTLGRSTKVLKRASLGGMAAGVVGMLLVGTDKQAQASSSVGSTSVVQKSVNFSDEDLGPLEDSRAPHSTGASAQ
jgi:hypothetical protein